MLTMQNGSDTLGYGPKLECPKCHNSINPSIKQEYFKSQAFLIPIANKRGRIFCQCDTCEAAWLLEKSEAMALLDSGKDFTKSVLMRLDPKHRQSIYKRLNDFGAHGIVAYLGS
jgi:hypothetical protein